MLCECERERGLGCVAAGTNCGLVPVAVVQPSLLAGRHSTPNPARHRAFKTCCAMRKEKKCNDVCVCVCDGKCLALIIHHTDPRGCGFGSELSQTVWASSPSTANSIVVPKKKQIERKLHVFIYVWLKYSNRAYPFVGLDPSKLDPKGLLPNPLSFQTQLTPKQGEDGSMQKCENSCILQCVSCPCVKIDLNTTGSVRPVSPFFLTR